MNDKKNELNSREKTIKNFVYYNKQTIYSLFDDNIALMTNNKEILNKIFKFEKNTYPNSFMDKQFFPSVYDNYQFIPNCGHLENEELNKFTEKIINNKFKYTLFLEAKQIENLPFGGRKFLLATNNQNVAKYASKLMLETYEDDYDFILEPSIICDEDYIPKLKIVIIENDKANIYVAKNYKEYKGIANFLDKNFNTDKII